MCANRSEIFACHENCSARRNRARRGSEEPFVNPFDLQIDVHATLVPPEGAQLLEIASVGPSNELIALGGAMGNTWSRSIP